MKTKHPVRKHILLGVFNFKQVNNFIKTIFICYVFVSEYQNTHYLSGIKKVFLEDKRRR
nr:MAG TPA: hypothetical protein [Caudoviricetes sp.]